MIKHSNLAHLPAVSSGVMGDTFLWEVVMALRRCRNGQVALPLAVQCAANRAGCIDSAAHVCNGKQHEICAGQ